MRNNLSEKTREVGQNSAQKLPVSTSSTGATCTSSRDINGTYQSPLEPRVLRYSDLGEAPEVRQASIRSYTETCLLVLFMVVFYIFLIPLLPVILIASLLQRILVARQKYHTDPSELKVAVIGGGWSGQQCIARLHELGVTNVTGFERNDGYGGTWHDKLRYYSLQMHTPMWVTGFKDFSYSDDRDISDGKVLGEEMRDFLGRFVHDKKLHYSFKYNTHVVGINYSVSDRKATLKLQSTDRSSTWTEDNYDLVIYASQASEPNMPKLPNKETYKGQVYHTIDFKKDVFDGILSNDRKVAIVGGSKAACDIALCLHRSKYNNFKWLYRKSYLFWKYEIIIHDRSLINSLRGNVTVVATLLSIVSIQLTGWLFWANKTVATFTKEKHNDWNKFHFGVLCPKQRRDLANISHTNLVQANPVAYTSTGIKLSNDESIDADVIIWATGYQSGIDKIVLSKDGEPYTLDPDGKMLDHFIFPSFPVLANSSSLWTTFGPMRAVNSAEMAIKHLCINKRRTEESMTKSASWNVAGSSTNAISGLLFQSKTNAMEIFVKMHLDLILRGNVNILDFIQHFVQIFSFGKQTPLKIRLPSRQADARY